MNPSNPARVGIAFVAGIVVALASAVVYVKSSGLHPHDAALTPAVQQAGPPESLNTAKVEDVTPTPAAKPPTAVAAEAPKPAPAAPADIPATAVRRIPRPRLVRSSYPRHSSLPESQSTIRVEVSQMTPSTIPALAPAAIPAAPPLVRTVNEDQAQAVSQPANGARYNAPIPAPPPQPHTITLQPGTNLVVRMGETISTEHNYSGDTFRATLDNSIVIDGFVIAEKGSKVLGKVVGADKAGKLAGTANLQLTLTEINTTDGQRVRIETGSINKRGPSNAGQEAAKIGGGAVLGAIIGAIAGGGKGAAIGAGAGGAAGTGAVFLGKGKPAVIPNEALLTFQLASPATITERFN
jgi:hypothetical protein